VKRNPPALGRADFHIVQVTDRIAFFLWKPDHDLDLVLAALNTLDFSTIETSPDLAG
jgi:hypothetical protein